MMPLKENMGFKAVYTRSAEQDLQELEKKIARRILQKIDYFLSSENPFKYAKRLSGFESETYRFRVGDYRIIFRIDEKKKIFVLLVILKIVHRKEAYSLR